MIAPLPNPIMTNNLLQALAQVQAAGRRVCAVDWNTPGWTKKGYRQLWDVHHTGATDTLTMEQARKELNSPKLEQASLL